MPGTVYSEQRTRTRRARLLTVAALLSGVVVAGCGGTSPGPTGSSSASASSGAGGSHATASGSSTTTDGGTTSSRSTPPDAGASGPLAFARCMRANGVSDFPDPKTGAGAVFIPAGNNPSAPAFMAAQAKCQKLMPVPGGPGGPTYSAHVKAQALAKLRKIAVCMRAHGVSDFPDPSPSRPSNLAGSGAVEITDFDGVFLVFPATINLEAPAYRHALTACGAPPLGLRH